MNRRFEDFKDIDMNSLIDTVLPWRSESYIEDFLLKMKDEGIEAPQELIRVRKELLETKLSTHSNFNYIEMADVVSLRSAMDPESAKNAHSKQNRGGRSRSRSPRRRGGRDSQRNNNRPHNASKNNERETPRETRRNAKRNAKRNSWTRENTKKKAKPELWNPNTKKKAKPELWKAVAQGDAAKVQELLNQGKDPTEPFEGWSPLMKASEEGNEEVIRMLLNKKVDIEVTNRKGRTALSFAAAPSNDGSTRRLTAVAAMRLLLQSGANAHKADEKGATAVSRANDEKRDDALAVFDEFGV